MTLSPITELQKMWSIFLVGQNNPISLRAISPKGAAIRMAPRNLTFNARDYPAIQDRKFAFQEAAFRFNVEGYNVYVVMNPIAGEDLRTWHCRSGSYCTKFIDKNQRVGK